MPLPGGDWLPVRVVAADYGHWLFLLVRTCDAGKVQQLLIARGCSMAPSSSSPDDSAGTGKDAAAPMSCPAASANTAASSTTSEHEVILVNLTHGIIPVLSSIRRARATYAANKS